MAPAGLIVVHVDPALESLIPRFLEHQCKALKTMRDAFEQQNYEAIVFAGHSMKGSAGGYGFDTMTDLGSALEQAAKVCNPTETATYLDALTDYLSRLEVTYDA